MNKAALTITSDNFMPGGMLPSKYTCAGMNVNPTLNIENLPKKAKSLVIIMEDVTPEDKATVLWVQYNIPAKNWINEDEKKGEFGLNYLNECSYAGPCTEPEANRLLLKVYALDDFLYFDHRDVSKPEIEEGIRYHLVGYGQMEAFHNDKVKYELARIP